MSVKKLCLCALLCGMALTIFVAEAQIPLPLPVPGLKLGLANIITLFALLYLSPKEALLILLGRIFLGAYLTGSPSALLYSLSGGLVCLVGELALIKLLGKNFICEISIFGAMLHNTTQILCAFAITKTPALFWYLPPLLVFAVISGAFCGLCIKSLDLATGKRIEKYLK